MPEERFESAPEMSEERVGWGQTERGVQEEGGQEHVTPEHGELSTVGSSSLPPQAEKRAPRYWRWSIKSGPIAALVGGGGAWAMGAVLVVSFGLLAFAKEWATIPTVVGIGLMTLNALVFLPVASVAAALVSVWLTRRHFGQFIGRPYLTTVGVAVLLLSVISVPLTAAMTFRAQRGIREADTVQQERTAAVADVMKVTGVSAAVAGENVLVQPTLTGTMPGQYRVSLAISYRVPLVTKTAVVRLPEERSSLDWSVPLSELRESYRQKLLTGNQPALVESTFSVVVELELVTPDDVVVNTALPPQAPERSSQAREGIKLDLGQV